MRLSTSCCLALLLISDATLSGSHQLQIPLTEAETRPIDAIHGVSLVDLETGAGTIHYAHNGNTEAPGILFIHGTPGNWEAFSTYLQSPLLAQKYFLVSIDRPGWGKSLLTNSDDTFSFAPTSTAIQTIFKRYPNKHWLIVGHSLGASIAPRVALDAQHRVIGLLLLAGSHSPKLGEPRWYNQAAHTWLIKKFLSKKLRRSNDEIMRLSKELQHIDDRLQSTQLDINVVQIQGMRDSLVSPKNVNFVKTNWSDHFSSLHTIELTEEGHFLPWRQEPLIIETILSFEF